MRAFYVKEERRFARAVNIGSGPFLFAELAVLLSIELLTAGPGCAVGIVQLFTRDSRANIVTECQRFNKFCYKRFRRYLIQSVNVLTSFLTKGSEDI